MSEKGKNMFQFDEMKNVQQDVQNLRSKFQSSAKRSREGSEDREGANKLREMLREKDAEIDCLQEQLTDVESKMRRQERKLLKEISELKNEIEELSDDLKMEKKNCSKYKHNIKKLEKNIEELEIQLYTKDAEFKLKERKIVEELRLEEDGKLEDAQKAIKTVMENDINQLKDTIENLNLEHQTSTDKIMTEKRIVLDKLKAKIDDCNAVIERSEDTINKEREKNEQLNSLLKNQQFTIADHESKIQKLERDLKESRRVISTLQTAAVPISMTARPVEESIVSRISKLEIASSEDCGDMAVCPNCGCMSSISSMEQHLDRCLEEF